MKIEPEEISGGAGRAPARSGRRSGSFARRMVLSALLLAAIAIFLPPRLFAILPTYVVDSVGDQADDNPGNGICHTAAGTCTLRAAIQEANAGSGGTIHFMIPGSACSPTTAICTISPASSLPTITKQVTINGYSQPGSAANTAGAFAPGNAALRIELNGAAAAASNGLTFGDGTSSSSVRGLVINRFPAPQIQIGPAVGADFITIGGNYIGTDPTGQTAAGGQSGVFLFIVGSPTIGGTAPADRNVIAGLDSYAVHIANGSGHSVTGNFIGTNASGTSAIGPAATGIMASGTPDLKIGGAASGAGNLIGGTSSALMLTNTIGSLVYGNRIGTNASGTGAIPNGTGIMLSGGVGSSSIGGTAAGQPNVIAFSGGAGVTTALFAGFGNAIRGNSIHDNGALGVDLQNDGVSPNDPLDPDTGPNNLQNFPVITGTFAMGPTLAVVVGTLNSTPDTTFWIDIYTNGGCDPSGFGEGRTLAGSIQATTNGGGMASFAPIFPVSPTGVFTGTATDPAGNTSEFSACFVNVGPGATLIPDGRASRAQMTGGSASFHSVLLAGRSYSVEVEAPSAGVGGTTPGTGPAPSLGISRGDGTPLSTAPASRSSCGAATAARLTLVPSVLDTALPVTIQVTDPSMSSYNLRARVVDTTLYCPRWSVNGYNALASVANTTGCVVSGQIVLTNSSGSSVATIPFTLNPGASAQLPLPAGSGALFGSALLTHDGPPGAIHAGIYMVQPGGSAAGANFRWPFLEVRASGSTDGR